MPALSWEEADAGYRSGRYEVRGVGPHHWELWAGGRCLSTHRTASEARGRAEVVEARRRRAGSVLRHLVVLGAAAAGFVAVLPWRAVEDPAFVSAREYLDGFAAAYSAIEAGGADPGDFSMEQDGFGGARRILDDGTVQTVVLGPHDGLCYLMYWQEPDVVGARAGILAPGPACEPSAELMATLPLPPLSANFPGTVPPFNLERLMAPTRMPHWFLPVVIALAATALWTSVGATLVLLGGRAPQGRRG